MYSTGYLLNPEMKRFQINTPVAFFPPNPNKVPNVFTSNPALPSFGAFFSAYCGGAAYQMSSPKCGKMLENLKKCYETNTPSGNPEQACAYYIDGFKRMACTN